MRDEQSRGNVRGAVMTATTRPRIERALGEVAQAAREQGRTGAGRCQPGVMETSWPRHWHWGRKERCTWLTAWITKSKKVEPKHLAEVTRERVTAIH